MYGYNSSFSVKNIAFSTVLFVLYKLWKYILVSSKYYVYIQGNILKNNMKRGINIYFDLVLDLHSDVTY